MKNYEIWSLVLGSTGVSIALSVLIVTIWGEKLRQLWSKPNLKLSFLEASLNNTRDGINGWYYILQVSNDKKMSPADNVEILLTNIYEKGPDDNWHEKLFSGQIPLAWRYPPYSGGKTVGREADATFGHIMENEHSFTMLPVAVVPNNLNQKILPNNPTKLIFIATSNTVNSEPLIVKVTWSGKWVMGKAEIEKECTIKTNQENQTKL